MVGAGLDSVAFQRHLSQDTLCSDERFRAESSLERGNAFAVVGAAENRTGFRSLSVNIEQQTAAPGLPNLRNRASHRPMIGIIIRFRVGGFEGGAFGAIGIRVFSFEASDDEKRLGAQALGDPGGQTFRQLSGIAVTLDGELRHADAAALRHSGNRVTPAMRRRKDNRQHARPDREPLIGRLSFVRLDGILA